MLLLSKELLVLDNRTRERQLLFDAKRCCAKPIAFRELTATVVVYHFCTLIGLANTEISPPKYVAVYCVNEAEYDFAQRKSMLK